jgi:2-polyprenyl-3-methyl-5-hydroxy-6-metoxy-1,4-benzoquinol methylase
LTASNLPSDCPACLASDSRLWASKSGHSLWRCAKCGSLFTSAEGVQQETEELYGHYYDRPLGDVPLVVLESLARIVRRAERYRRTGMWLDIGYGEGALLSLASKNGWRCHGTEIAPAVLERGRLQGWEVATSTQDGSRFPEGGFDVVTLIETLEHVAGPRAFLADAARLLRPGGVLFLTTPNADGLNRRLLGSSWSVISPPEHLTLWTTRGLVAATASLGFEVDQLRTEGFNPIEVLGRLSPVAGKPLNRNEAGLALNSAFSASRWRRACKRSVNAVLSLLTLGDTLKMWARRKAD